MNEAIARWLPARPCSARVATSRAQGHKRSLFHSPGGWVSQPLRLGGGGHPLGELSWVRAEVDAKPRLDQQASRGQHVEGDLRICHRIVGMLDALVGSVEFLCPRPSIPAPFIRNLARHLNLTADVRDGWREPRRVRQSLPD
jgi:hypothetical protein